MDAVGTKLLQLKDLSTKVALTLKPAKNPSTVVARTKFPPLLDPTSKGVLRRIVTKRCLDAALIIQPSPRVTMMKVVHHHLRLVRCLNTVAVRTTSLKRKELTIKVAKKKRRRKNIVLRFRVPQSGKGKIAITLRLVVAPTASKPPRVNSTKAATSPTATKPSSVVVQTVLHQLKAQITKAAECRALTIHSVVALTKSLQHTAPAVKAAVLQAHMAVAQTTYFQPEDPILKAAAVNTHLIGVVRTTLQQLEVTTTKVVGANTPNMVAVPTNTPQRLVPTTKAASVTHSSSGVVQMASRWPKDRTSKVVGVETPNLVAVRTTGLLLKVLISQGAVAIPVNSGVVQMVTQKRRVITLKVAKLFLKICKRVVPSRKNEGPVATTLLSGSLIWTTVGVLGFGTAAVMVTPIGSKLRRSVMVYASNLKDLVINCVGVF